MNGNALPQKYTAQSRLLFFSGTAIIILGSILLLSSHIDQLLSSNATQPEVQLREAEGYLRQNSKDAARQALRIFNHVLARDISPTMNQKAKYGMAVALEHLEEHAAALQHYRELEKQKIHEPVVRDQVDYGLGRFYLYLDHEKEGSSLLHALLNRTRDKALKSKVYTAFGMYYLRSKQYKRSEANFRVALKYDQENLSAQEGRAQAVKGQGRDWTAYRYYDDYLFGTARLNPGNRQVVLNKVEQEVFESGILAFHKGRIHNAISFFKKVCRTTKNASLEEKARFWIAESYRALGLKSKALQMYASVLHNSVTDKDAVALFRQASLLFEQGKHDQAAKIFTKLQASYPDSEYSIKAKEYLAELHDEKEAQGQLGNSEYKHYTPENIILRQPEMMNTAPSKANASQNDISDSHNPPLTIPQTQSQVQSTTSPPITEEEGESKPGVY